MITELVPSAMTPDMFAICRVSLGGRRMIANLLGVTPSWLAARESGRVSIQPPEAQVLEDLLRARLHWQATRPAEEAISPGQFRACLHNLNWDNITAAQNLIGHRSEDAALVGAWAMGTVPVPDWIARHMRRFLKLGMRDSWPEPAAGNELGPTARRQSSAAV